MRCQQTRYGRQLVIVRLHHTPLGCPLHNDTYLRSRCVVYAHESNNVKTGNKRHLNKRSSTNSGLGNIQKFRITRRPITLQSVQRGGPLNSTDGRVGSPFERQLSQIWWPLESSDGLVELFPERQLPVAGRLATGLRRWAD